MFVKENPDWKKANEIYHLHFLKDIVLNHSLKGTMNTLLILFYQQSVCKMKIDQQIALSSNGSYQKDFRKVTILNRSMKGAVTGSCW